MDKCKISVIVPVYLVEKYLSRCVDSILVQTYSNLEVILVDDGSTDHCGEICDQYAQMDSRVRVVHKSNGGLSSARNAGIDIITGEYIAFADSDDWLEPDTYEVMIHAAQKYDAQMVCAGRYDENEANGMSAIGLCPVQEQVFDGKTLIKHMFRWQEVDSAAWDKLYRAELFQTIRYPEGRVMEDIPVTYRLALQTERAVLLPKPVYHYLHRTNSITTAPLTEKSFHGIEHAKMVYDDIRQTHPELEKEAHFMLAKMLYYALQMIELADPSNKSQYIGRYSELKNDINKELVFILLCSWFSLREKMECFLMAKGCYQSAHAVYYKLKHL